MVRGHRAALLTAFLAFGTTLHLNPATVNAQADENASEVRRPLTETSSAGLAHDAATAMASKPYYIEFRARSAQSYGHTFSMYGRLNEHGGIATKTVAGLHPFTESELPWMIGHLIMVPSETGASDGDTEDQYLIARFRIALGAAEYKKVTAFIKDLQGRSPVWHAVLYNCNAFVGDIARFMGLDTSVSPLHLPKDYINGLRDLNMSKAGAPGVIGTPVKVADPEKLRAAALRAIEQHEHRPRMALRRNAPSRVSREPQ
jgi:hypothetical protein